jgi:hypothetical protein
MPARAKSIRSGHGEDHDDVEAIAMAKTESFIEQHRPAYHFVLHRERGGSYWLEFPEFEEATGEGRELDDAMEVAQKTLRDAIYFRMLFKRDLPECLPGKTGWQKVSLKKQAEGRQRRDESCVNLAAATRFKTR